MRLIKWMAVLGVGGLLLWSATISHALTVNPLTGEVTDWGFTPFGTQMGDWTNGSPPLATGVNGTNSGQDATTAWTEGNNSSPIDFPGGPPNYVPSPAGSRGERYDLELLAWRTVTPTRIQVLGITSVDPNAGSTLNASTFHLGDVFIDVDGDKTTGVDGYEFALTAGQWTTPLNDPLNVDDNPNVPGNQVGYSHTDAIGLYEVETIHGITNQGGAYGGYSNPAFPLIPSALNPFAVRTGVLQTNANLLFDSEAHNYGNPLNGADENGTWLLEWTFDIAPFLGQLPIDPLTGRPTLQYLTFHWTTECGNDLLERGPRDNPIPEPATLALMGLGLASMGLLRRRVRRA